MLHQELRIRVCGTVLAPTPPCSQVQAASPSWDVDTPALLSPGLPTPPHALCWECPSLLPLWPTPLPCSFPPAPVRASFGKPPTGLCAWLCWAELGP